MAVIIDELFNSGANNDSLTTTNSTFSLLSNSGGTAIFSSSSPIEGSTDVVFSVGGTSANYIATSQFAGTTSVAYVSVMGRYDALPSAQLYIYQVMSGTSTVRGGVRFNTNGSVVLRNGTVAVATSTTTVVANTLWRIDAKFDYTLGQCEANIYVGSAVYTTLPSETISGTFNTGTMDRATFGITAAATNVSYRMGRAYLSDSAYPAPLSAGSAPTVSLAIDPASPEAFETVTLTASATDDGTISSYNFSQTGGVSVTLSGSGSIRTFTAPALLPTNGQETLLFSVTATDNDGNTSSPANVSVVIPVHPEWWVDSGGVLKARRHTY